MPGLTHPCAPPRRGSCWKYWDEPTPAPLPGGDGEAVYSLQIQKETEPMQSLEKNQLAAPGTGCLDLSLQSGTNDPGTRYLNSPHQERVRHLFYGSLAGLDRTIKTVNLGCLRQARCLPYKNWILCDSHSLVIVFSSQPTLQVCRGSKIEQCLSQGF